MRPNWSLTAPALVKPCFFINKIVFMKIFLLPVFRFIFCLYCIAFAPVLFIGHAIHWLWDFGFNPLRELYRDYFVEFQEQHALSRKHGQPYYFYKNPYHYLIDKKSWKSTT